MWEAISHPNQLSMACRVHLPCGAATSMRPMARPLISHARMPHSSSTQLGAAHLHNRQLTAVSLARAPLLAQLRLQPLHLRGKGSSTLHCQCPATMSQDVHRLIDLIVSAFQQSSLAQCHTRIGKPHPTCSCSWRLSVSEALRRASSSAARLACEQITQGDEPLGTSKHAATSSATAFASNAQERNLCARHGTASPCCSPARRWCAAACRPGHGRPPRRQQPPVAPAPQPPAWPPALQTTKMVRTQKARCRWSQLSFPGAKPGMSRWGTDAVG